MNSQNTQSTRTEDWISRRMSATVDCRALFSPGHVTIALGEDAAASPAAHACFAFAVNLAARLYPIVQRLTIVAPAHAPLLFAAPRWRSDTLAKHLSGMLEALRPPVHWEVSASYSRDSSVNLIVGHVPPRDMIDCESIHVVSDGWEVFFSEGPTRGFGNCPNAVGAYTAACFAVAEMWKRLLLPRSSLFPFLPIAPTREPLRFSSFTYMSDGDGPNPSLPATLSLEDAAFIGVGAGGGACLFTLATAAELVGNIALVDPDRADAPNLNRYVFADAADAAASSHKVAIAEKFLRASPRLIVQALPVPFHAAQADLVPDAYRRVIAAVHTRESRREIQYETPLVLWDSGADQDGEFQVWRHDFGRTACIHCRYPVAGDPEIAKAQQLSSLLGLSPECWRRKLRDNETFRSDEVEKIAAHRAANASYALPEVGQAYGDWEASQCGRIRLQELAEEIPVPFAPVLAGVFLAGEVIKDCAFPEHALDGYYRNTLVGRFDRRAIANRRLPSKDCALCSNPAFRGQFERRWGR